MRSTQLILSICFMALLVMAKKDDRTEKQTINQHDKKVLDFWMNAGRGFWTGYTKEIYHGQRTLSKNCFATDSEDDIIEILTFMLYLDYTRMWIAADALYNLMNENFYMCGIRDTFNEITTRCAEPEACSITGIYYNLFINGFKLVATANSVVDVALNFDISSDQAAYETMYEVGSDCAEFITSVFGL